MCCYKTTAFPTGAIMKCVYYTSEIDKNRWVPLEGTGVPNSHPFEGQLCTWFWSRGPDILKRFSNYILARLKFATYLAGLSGDLVGHSESCRGPHLAHGPRV